LFCPNPQANAKGKTKRAKFSNAPQQHNFMNKKNKDQELENL